MSTQRKWPFEAVSLGAYFFIGKRKMKPRIKGRHLSELLLTEMTVFYYCGI